LFVCFFVLFLVCLCFLVHLSPFISLCLLFWLLLVLLSWIS
jgi:hypothetical protein